MHIVRQKEKTTTQQYDWFNNNEGAEYVFRETYKDSEAILNHMANVGELLGKMAAIAELSVEFYGDLSPKLMQAVAPFNPKIYQQFNPFRVVNKRAVLKKYV
ncbi:hypothetical protein [Eudoraea chungangensis]|uniref:hypothetical protein n=1 Tax=Eudoraea chungangensis TaxID=1481905 RepID=UPI0023EB59D6|nr:hypothetical protein [Eudoraea chungangensis]